MKNGPGEYEETVERDRSELVKSIFVRRITLG